MNIVHTILLTFIAICTLWIAAQQMLIARQKLTHDLFDRRFTIYNSTLEYLLSIINASEDFKIDHRGFLYSVKSAPFLFDNEIVEFLREVRRRGAELTLYSNRLSRTDCDEDRQNYLTRVDNHMDWFSSQLDGDNFDQRFYSTLSLSRVRPMSVYGFFFAGHDWWTRLKMGSRRRKP